MLASPGVHRRGPTAESTGEIWLWWDPKAKRRRTVELDDVPASNTRRVRVQHLDADMAGLREWAHVGRCLVPVDLRADYEKTQALWAALYAFKPPVRDAELVADVLEVLVGTECAEIHYNYAGGILEVHDLPRLAERTRLSVDRLTARPEVFVENEVIFAPWPTTLEVVQRLCERNPKQMLTYIRARERDAESHHHEWAVEHWRSSVLDSRTFDEVAHTASEAARESLAHERYLIAAWCNANAPDVGMEYLALADQYDKLVAAVLPTLDQLRMIRTKRARAMVDRLERILDPSAESSARVGRGADGPWQARQDGQ